jgi:hypothetical protein
MQSIHIPMVAPLYAAHKPLLADRFKTKLCETFEREGYCSYDARCMFAHGSDDLRSKEMNLLDGLVTDDAIRNFAAERYGAAAATVDPNRSIVADRFKTRSCENFKRHGECSFAHRCMFAHGEEELRTTEMNIRRRPHYGGGDQDFPVGVHHDTPRNRTTPQAQPEEEDEGARREGRPSAV